MSLSKHAFFWLILSVFVRPDSIADASPAIPPPAASPLISGFYYYCEGSKSYYPTVTSCPGSWIAMPIGPPPAYPQWNENRESPDLVRAHPNSATLELFGRALLYSVNYDRSISNHFSLGAGISSWEASARHEDYRATLFVVPVYVNYYFSQKAWRGFLTGGMEFIHVSNDGPDHNTFEHNGLAALLGAGYEILDQSGFLTRLAAYLIIGRSVTLSPSVSVGIAF